MDPNLPPPRTAWDRLIQFISLVHVGHHAAQYFLFEYDEEVSNASLRLLGKTFRYGPTPPDVGREGCAREALSRQILHNILSDGNVFPAVRKQHLARIAGSWGNLATLASLEELFPHWAAVSQTPASHAAASSSSSAIHPNIPALFEDAPASALQRIQFFLADLYGDTTELFDKVTFSQLGLPDDPRWSVQLMGREYTATHAYLPHEYATPQERKLYNDHGQESAVREAFRQGALHRILQENAVPPHYQEPALELVAKFSQIKGLPELPESTAVLDSNSSDGGRKRKHRGRSSSRRREDGSPSRHRSKSRHRSRSKSRSRRGESRSRRESLEEGEDSDREHKRRRRSVSRHRRSPSRSHRSPSRSRRSPSRSRRSRSRSVRAREDDIREYRSQREAIYHNSRDTDREDRHARRHRREEDSDDGHRHRRDRNDRYDSDDERQRSHQRGRDRRPRSPSLPKGPVTKPPVLDARKVENGYVSAKEGQLQVDHASTASPQDVRPTTKYASGKQPFKPPLIAKSQPISTPVTIAQANPSKYSIELFGLNNALSEVLEYLLAASKPDPHSQAMNQAAKVASMNADILAQIDNPNRQRLNALLHSCRLSVFASGIKAALAADADASDFVILPKSVVDEMQRQLQSMP